MVKDLDPVTYVLWNRIHDVVNFFISLTFLIIYIISFYYLQEFKDKCCTKNDHIQEEIDLSTMESTKYDTAAVSPRTRTAMKKQKTLDRPTVITSMIYISFYAFRYFLFCINWMVIADNNDEAKEKVDPNWYEFVAHTLDLCFVIAHGAFYLLMILRLNRAFNGTIYEFNKYIIYSFYFGLFVIVLVDILYFYVYEPGHETRTHLFFTLVALDLVLGFILIYGFVHKLFGLVVSQRETLISMSSTKDVNKNGKNNELSGKQLYFIGLATKYALLCSIAIIFTNLQFTGWAIFFLTSEFTENYWAQLLLNWAYDVVLFTEMYCIWLSYPFATDHYFKVCSPCHNLCMKMFECCVGKMIQKDIEKTGKPLENDLELPAKVTPVDSD